MDLNELFNRSLTADSQEFLKLIHKVSQILSEEERNARKLRITGRLVRLPPLGKAVVVGDIHGDLSSLRHILSDGRILDKLSSERDFRIIFLGDYGDRGVYSPEVYYVILTLKKSFPDKVILLEGNHEGPEDLLAYPHDLPYHLNRKFGSNGPLIYRELSRLFRRFYTAVIVEEKCVMLHGGVPSEAKSIEDVAFAHEKHPSRSHLEEILWSDPVDGISGKYPSPRGAGYLFGRDVTERFLKILGVKLLIRGHEPADRGYKFNHEGRVLTLFSRKGAPYHNTYAAYLVLNFSENLDHAGKIEKRIRRF